MQVEHKTEKGTVLFVKVPDDSKLHHIKENSGGCYLQFSCMNEKHKITVGTSDYFAHGKWQLIGLTSEVNEDQAKMIIKSMGRGDCFKNYADKLGNSFTYAIDSFKSLMQHLHINESEKWIVLFKPNEKE